MTLEDVSRQRRHPTVWEPAAVLIALLFMAVYVWPASIAPAHWVWGGFGDALGNVSLMTWIDQALRHHQPLTLDRSIAIPFGENLGVLPHEPLYFIAAVLMTRLLGAVTALNLITFVSAPLAAWSMFRLVDYIVTCPPAACLGGVAFGSSTFILHNSQGEPTLVQIWVFPLAALMLLRLLAGPSLQRVLLASAAVAASATVNFYFSLFAAAMCAALVGAWCVGRWIGAWRFPVHPFASALAAGVLGIVTAGVLVAATNADVRATAARINRPAVNLDKLAADPLDVLLPPTWNPWIGAPSREHYLARFAKTGEFFDLSEMSVSAPILVLAPLGAVLMLLPWPSIGADRRLEAFSLLLVGAIGAWLVVPPGALPRFHRLALQLDLHNMFPQYQHFSRSIVLIDLALMPLAALALARIVQRWSGLGTLLVVVLIAASLFESYERIPHTLLEVVAPPEVAWLQQKPGDYAVADLPLVPGESGGNEYTALYYQRFHGHPLLNGQFTATESESMRDEMRDPNLANVPERMAALGVRYLVWHPDIMASYDRLNHVLAQFYIEHQPQPPGYQLDARFHDGGAVYSVAAAPTPIFAFYASGFGPVAAGPDGAADRTLVSENKRGSIAIFARHSGTATLTLTCLGAQGTLQLDAPHQSPLGQWRIDARSRTPISLQLPLESGITRISLTWRPDITFDLAAPQCSLIEAQ